jgi:hypothetical protein
MNGSNPILPLMTLDEVAAGLGVSRAWVRDHATRRNPRMPHGPLRRAPGRFQSCVVLTDPALFARMTSEQLRVALAESNDGFDGVYRNHGTGWYKLGRLSRWIEDNRRMQRETMLLGVCRE